MAQSSVEEVAGIRPQRSPRQMVFVMTELHELSSFQFSPEKCCSIEMVEEPEEKFRFRYKSEMQVNIRRRRRRRE